MSSSAEGSTGSRVTWRDVAEGIGIISIVASLIFVGLQVRQEAAATRSQTVLELKAAWVELNLTQATSVELQEAFETIRKEGYDADVISRSLVEGFYRTLLHNWSNGYYQYRIGTLDDGQWAPYRREVELAPHNEILREVWTDWEHVYDDPFRELMNASIATAEGAAATD